jgi:glycosyltransferase involved in cell wall biosynthesis
MFDPPALASIDHFIAVAQTVGHVLTKRYAVSPNRITPIYYGIADPLDSLSVQTHTAVRAGLGLGLNTLVIGMPARFAPEKGHRYLIQALSSIRDQIDGHIDVVLMGSGQLLDQSRLAVRDAGLNSIIKFTGQISHEKVLEIMKICELIVLPSEIEGLPYVISEAMSMGKPVIATAVGGVPEQIVHGETGLVIQPREPADLAQAILHLVKQPELREKMGRAARTRYEHYFTLNRMLRDHDALYQTLYQNYYATGLDHHTGL